MAAAAPAGVDRPPLFAAMANQAADGLQGIVLGLNLSIRLHDFDRIKIYCAQLNKYFDDRYPILLPTRRALVRLVYDFLGTATAREMDILVRNKLLLVLKSLLIGSLNDDLELGEQPMVLDWKVLQDLLLTVHVAANESVDKGNFSELSKHSHQLTSVVQAARRFFAPEATEELLRYHRPHLSKFDVMLHRSFALLCLFLPTNHPEQCSRWLRELREVHSWIDRNFGLTKCWMSLLARVLHHCHPALLPPDLTDWLPELLTQFLHSLPLMVRGGSHPNPGRAFASFRFLLPEEKTNSIGADVAKIFVACLRPLQGQQEAADAPHRLLSQLLRNTLSTYFHPSNGGQWTSPIFVFVEQLVRSYSVRRLSQQSVARGWPETPSSPYQTGGRIGLQPVPQLGPTDDAWLVQLLEPIFLQGLYSKAHFNIVGSSKALSNLCFLQPSLVLRLAERFAEDLQSAESAHRTLSAFLGLSAISLPLVAMASGRLGVDTGARDELGFMRSSAAIPPDAPSEEEEEDGLGSGVEQGTRLLQKLLFLALPGIDPIDDLKSIGALTCLSRFFSVIPMFTDADRCPSEARMEFAAHLEDFCEQFMSRLISFLEHQEGSSSGSGSGSESQETVSGPQVYIVFTTMRTFFSALDSKLFQRTLNHVVRSVTSQVHAENKKLFGTVLKAAACANPSDTIRLAFDPLYRSLVTGDGKLRESLSSSHLRWYAYMLANAIKYGGAELLPKVAQLKQVRRELRAHKDSGVKEHAAILVRSALTSLTAVYAEGHRPAVGWPADAEAERDWSHWDHWAAWQEMYRFRLDGNAPESPETDWPAPWDPVYLFYPRTVEQGFGQGFLDPKIRWHLPSEPEVTAARELCLDSLSQPVHELVAAMNSCDQEFPVFDGCAEPELAVDDQNMSDDGDGNVAAKPLGKPTASQIEAAMMEVLRTAQGCTWVLGDWGQNSEQQEDGPQQLHTRLVTADTTLEELVGELEGGDRLPELVVRPSLMQAQPAIELSRRGIRSSLRVYLFRLVRTFLRACLLGPTPGYATPKTCERLVMLLDWLLRSQPTETEQRMRNLGRIFFESNGEQAKWTGHQVITRSLMVPAAESLMTRRLYRAQQPGHTADIQEALMDLGRLALESSFAKVRDEAAGLLSQCVKFPYFQHRGRVVEQMLQVLRQTNRDAPEAPTREQLLAAVHVLEDLARAVIVRSWTLLTRVLMVICHQAQHHADDVVQLEIHSLFLRLYRHMYSLSVFVPPILPPAAAGHEGGFPATLVERRNVYLRQQNDLLVGRHRDLVVQLLNVVEKESRWSPRMSQAPEQMVSPRMRSPRSPDDWARSNEDELAGPAEPHIGSPVAAAAAGLSEGLDAILPATVATTTAAAATAAAPVELATPGQSLHWRYRLVATALLFACVRSGTPNVFNPGTDQATDLLCRQLMGAPPADPEEPFPDLVVSRECSATPQEISLQGAVLLYFAECLTSSLVPLRTVAIRAVGSWLTAHRTFHQYWRRQPGRTEVSVLKQLTAGDPRHPLLGAPAAAADGTVSVTAPEDLLRLQQELWSQSSDDRLRGEIFADSLSAGWRLPERAGLLGLAPGACAYDQDGHPVQPLYLQPSQLAVEGAEEQALAHLSLGLRMSGEVFVAPIHPQSMRLLLSYLVGQVEALVQSCAADHPLVAQSKQANVMGNRSSQSLGTGQDIADIVVDGCRQLPQLTSRHPPISRDFSLSHLDLFVGLIDMALSNIRASPEPNLGASGASPVQGPAGVTISVAGADDVWLRELPDAPWQLLRKLQAQLRKMAADHHELENQCMAAELWAAFASALRHYSELPVAAECRNVLIEVLEEVSRHCQQDAMTVWCEALRHSSNSDPRRLRWLLDPLLRKVFAGRSPFADVEVAAEEPEAARGMSPSEQTRHLGFLLAVLREQGWRSAWLSDWILGQLLEQERTRPSSSVLRSPYEYVRNMAGRLVAQVLVNQDRVIVRAAASAAVDARLPDLEQEIAAKPASRRVFVEYLAETLATIRPRGSSAPSPASPSASSTAEEASAAAAAEVASTAEEKSAKWFLDTLVFGLMELTASGDAVFCTDVYLPLLPHLVRLSSHPDRHTAQCTTYQCLKLAWSEGLSPSVLGSWLQAMLDHPVKDPDWHVRVRALNFLGVLVPRFCLLLQPPQEVKAGEAAATAPTWSFGPVLSAVVTALQDPQLEVRQAASELLTSFAMCVPAEALGNQKSGGGGVEKLVRRFRKLAATRVPTKQAGQPETEERRAALVRRHAGVLGLQSLVHSFPYEVPDFLPEVLEALCNHINDPPPIRGSAIRATFDEFRRTHADEWESRFVFRFNADQLEAIGSVSTTQSYFA